MDESAGLRDRLQRAARVCVLTGAGMSAESGVPTFRDALTGLWTRFDPAQLASDAGFRANPGPVWDWYAERREAVRHARPNPGHLALAEYAGRRPGVLTLVTQNVDDLHQRAGNGDAIRLHGDLLRNRWLDRCTRADGNRGLWCDPSWAEPARPPRCAQCGNMVRPDVVWFGENLPIVALQQAEAAAEHCEVMLVVGTSGAVWPAAGLAARARAAGGYVAILNPAPSEIDGEAHVVLRGTAAEWLPRLLSA